MSTEQSPERRLTQLEELLSYQEHRLQQLDEVLLKLHNKFDEVEAKLKQRIDQVETRLDSRTADYDMDEKPPHY